MEFSSFFNSVGHDRRYKAEDWAEYFADFIGNGIYPIPSVGLQVVATGSMTVTLQPGRALINGYRYKNTANKAITLETADGTLKRIARIVIQWNRSLRDNVVVVKYSGLASNPVAPPLQRDADAYEICVAEILIGKGVTGIQQAAVTDTRWNTTLCGIVAGVVQQIDATAITAQFDDFFALYRELITTRFTEYNGNAATAYANFIAALTAFQTSSETSFTVWFEGIQGMLQGDVAANLAATVQDLTGRVFALEQQAAVTPEYFTVAWLGSGYLGTTYLNGEV